VPKGGVARRVTFIERERAQSPNVLVLDAGNAFFGEEARGRLILEAMNAMGYDAMAIGDRDFWFGVGGLRKLMAEAKFPFLSANIVLSDTGELLAQPYIIKEIGGRKVGIIGISSPVVTRIANSPPGLAGPVKETVTVKDVLETARECVEKVRKETNIVIVLSNLGSDEDQWLARSVPGITVIVGGRDRVRLYPPLKIEETGTLIVQAYLAGEYMGRLHLTIDGQGVVTDYEGELVALTPDFPDDPEMKALVEKLEGK